MSIRVGLRHMARSVVYRPAVYDAYRRSNEIKGSTGGAQTDYQVRLNVYYEARDWTKELDALLEVGSPGDWDDEALNFPYVLKVGDTYYLYYSGYSGGFGNEYTGLATSMDGKNFTKINTGIGGTSKVLDTGGAGDWDEDYAWGASVVYHDGTFYMFYTGRDVATGQEDVGVATSPDGVNFTKFVGNPILVHGGGGWRNYHLSHADVAWDAENNVWVMLASGMEGVASPNHETIGRYYCSEAEFPYTWHEDAGNPVIDYNEQAGVDDYHCYHPSIYPSKVDGKWYVYYTSATAYAAGRTISRATTTSLYDGSFTKDANNPIIAHAADRWDDETNLMPSLRLQIDGSYALYYLGIDTVGNGIGLALSESIDGLGVRYLDECSLNERCRTDFGDIRFKTDDTELDYWLEEKIDSDYAVFWVKVPTIPASPGTVTIYIYYGKEDATTTSSIKDASWNNIGDDFNDNSRDTGIWDTCIEGAGSVAETNQRLEMTAPALNTGAGYVTVNAFAMNNVGIEILLHDVTLSEVGLWLSNQKVTNAHPFLNNDFYRIFLDAHGSDFSVQKRVAGGARVLLYDGAWVANEEKAVILIENNTIRFYEVATERANEIFALTSRDCYLYLFGRVNYIGEDGTDWADTFWIRKYVSPEPTIIAWGSEEAVMWPF